MTNKASRHIAPAKKIINYNYDHTTFIILAAAIGKRMKTYGPKALLEYQPEFTVLDHELQTIYEVYPQADILLVIGFEYEKFLLYKSKYPSIRLIYNPNYSTTNTLYSTQLGVQASIGNKIVVLHGDLMFSEESIAGLTERGSRITVCDTINKESVGVVSHNSIATNISYGLETQWGQITYFTNKEYQLLLQLVQNDKDSRRLFLYEAIKYIINHGGKFRIHNPEGIQIYDIDSHKDLEYVKGLL